MDEGQGRGPSTRDAVLERLSRVKLWVVGGTVALTGVFSALAAHALPASHAKSKPAAAPASPPVSPPVDNGAAQPASPSIAPPAEVPQPSADSSGAVSGGS
jgi:hypothetical protein